MSALCTHVHKRLHHMDIDSADRECPLTFWVSLKMENINSITHTVILNMDGQMIHLQLQGKTAS